MNRLVIFLIAGVVFASCGNKRAKLESDDQKYATIDSLNGPVMRFEQSTYDFGRINSGEKISYDFRFKNVGKRPLIITNAQASCGCTVPDYPREAIGPGKEATISVVFNSTGKVGMQNKVVTLTSNSVPSKYELHLVGEVIERVRVEGEIIN